VISLTRSIAFRAGLAQAALATLILALLAALLWWVITDRLDQQMEDVITGDSRLIATLAAQPDPKPAIQDISERVGSDLDEDEILLLTAPNFARLAGNLPAWPIDAPAEPGWGTVVITRGGIVSSARVLYMVLPNGRHLLVGRDLRARAELAEEFRGGLIGAVIMVLATGLVSAWILRRGFVDRVEQIDAMSQAIVAGKLDERLPVRARRDELDLLATTINRMLGQIEQLVGGVRNVSNAIAHDLRTPLGELRTRLEGLLLGRHVTGPAAEQVERAIDDTDRLIGTFNALLRLAELDTGARRSGFRPVQLAPVIEPAVELYEPLAESRAMRLTAQLAPDAPPVMGDPALLTQAMANLLDNALKFSAPDTEIVVSLTGQPNETVVLCVADRGPGIPDSEKPHVLDRFFRGASSSGTQGVGLGLSMVASIVTLHGGELRLEDNHPGLRILLVLPALKAAAGESRVRPSQRVPV
jgi:signal transduction histidine kinase